MDKKNTTIGLLLLITAFGMMFWQNRQTTAYQQEQARTREAQRQEMVQQALASQAERPLVAPSTVEQPAFVASAPAAQAVDPSAPAITSVLENDFVRIEFTSWGGAISNVAFKQYPAVQGEDAPYVFNALSATPALALDTWADGKISPQTQPYSVEEISDTTIVFVRQISPGVTMRRSYQISLESEGAAPYTIKHTTSVINDGTGIFAAADLYMDLGLAAPDASDHYGYSLNAGYYNGDAFIYERASSFEGGGMFSRSDPKPYIEKTDQIVWATTKNPFFASILTPVKPAKSIVMRAVLLPPIDGKPSKGLAASIGFEIPPLAPGQRDDVTVSCYIGPKEYKRLAKLDEHQDKVMQFGWSKPLGFIGNFVGFVGKLFYTGLIALQGLLVNWGVAIIVMTIIIRLIFWPLTAKAAENSRKMARLQIPLKEIKEKYKDNQKKLNEETMALFKKYKVNPLAGCVPILIQVPIFIAFYYMLRGASELRFGHFLWISDLSLPDTVAVISGFPINILPLFMGATMLYQMHLTPNPSMDATQAKIMKFMPLIFLFFCYNFSSGLVLYWTVSNGMSILQQLHTNHKRTQEETLEAAKQPLKVPDYGNAKKPRKRK